MEHVGQLPEQASANMSTLGRLQAQLQAETEALNRARQQETMTQALLAAGTTTTPLTMAPAPAPPVEATPAPTTEDALTRLKRTRNAVQSALEQVITRYA